MTGLFQFLTRNALRILVTVAAVIMLAVGAMLVAAYVRAQHGTPITATYGQCSSRLVYRTSATSHSTRSHRVWDCSATWTLNGAAHHTTVRSLDRSRTPGQTARAYASGNDLFFTSKGQFGVGLGLLIGGALAGGVAVWLWLRARRPKIAAPTEWATPA